MMTQSITGMMVAASISPPSTWVAREAMRMKTNSPDATKLTFKLSTALRGILPVAAWDLVAGRVFGVYKSMEHFTGRN